MVSSQDEKKMANAVGGKTARACDNCIKKRARWYCPADDAFLCQSCDISVHSANPLARRHERVRLKIISNSSSSSMMMMITTSSRQSSPSWHRGFTKKARTPRRGGNKHASSTTTTNYHVLHHLVPELVCSNENSHDSNYYNEDQLVYRVPIFDPFHVSELCTTSNSIGGDDDESNMICNKDVMMMNTYDVVEDCINDDLNHHHHHHHDGPSELELDEFAADVESLLGKGLEAAESFDMELGLGLNSLTEPTNNSKIKVEQEQEQQDDQGELMEDQVLLGYDDDDDDHHQQVNTEIIDLAREATFELNFDYYDEDSPMTCDQEIENKPSPPQLLLDQRELITSSSSVIVKKDDDDDDSVIPTTKKIILSLNYDDVIAAWDEQRSPWTNGERPPELDSKDYSWPADCLGLRVVGPYGEGMMLGHGGGGGAMADVGREARVTRYREKRRTRLFSKKIRYEVRKLNAEKRPRMKGRFVKRTTNLSPSIPNIIALPLHNK